jgi:DNA-nicking Smr family endonuclease
MGDKKKLSSEDRILWGKVARTTRALPGRMDALDEFEATFAEVPQDAPAAAVPPAKTTEAQAGKADISTRSRHHPLERPVKRKLSRGHLKLEARIDLHGLFQSEAHALLRDFIIHAHERGLRHVLVITGKGASMGSEGALKRAVPLWFSKPDFSPFISSYEPAAQNHGGEGALYVRLSRQRTRQA